MLEQKDELKKEITQLNNRLSELIKNNSNILDCVFIYKIQSEEETKDAGILFNFRNPNESAEMNHIFNLMHLDCVQQGQYQNSSINGDKNIVRCVKDSNLPCNVSPLKEGRLYKITDINYFKGKKYYQFENLPKQRPGFRGYNSQRFETVDFINN